MIETERLLLRPWREADRAAWTSMNADPEVGYWLGGVLSGPESDAVFDRTQADIDLNGYGMWAAERRIDGVVIGRIGVRRIPLEWAHPMSGEVEIGWRLAREAWGGGYAAEGSKAALDWGLANLDVTEIVAFTADTNLRSQAVMGRIGLERDPSRDFDHPNLAESHPLRHHLVYAAKRLARPQ